MNMLSVDFSSLYFGTPVALLSTRNPDGTTNLSPISSWWILDNSLMIGLATANQCYENIANHPEIVLNIPDARLWRNIEAIAATSAKTPLPTQKKKMGYGFEKDKFSRSRLNEVGSICVSPGSVKECPVKIEARMIRQMPLGESGEELAAMEARILRVHIAEELLGSRCGNPRFLVEKWQPLYYIFRHYYSVGERLGENFRCDN